MIDGVLLAKIRKYSKRSMTGALNMHGTAYVDYIEKTNDHS